MKLTILGSGTAVPLLDRNCAGYLLEINNTRENQSVVSEFGEISERKGAFAFDSSLASHRFSVPRKFKKFSREKLLFDSGAGTIRRLLELKINLFDIDNLFYTHLHNDHINDLGAIIWSNNYGGIRKNPLNLYGPKGLKQYYNILVKKLLKPAKINFKINVKELTKSAVKIKNITVKTNEIRHSITTKSIAYRIKHQNKTLVYAGDAEYCNEVIEVAMNADALLIECSFPDNKRIKGHLTPSLAGKIASKAKVKRLILTHFYPEALKADIKKQCKKRFKGEVILAKDKMKINL